MGKKKQPFYRIVATDSRVARDGKYIEKIGHYNPVDNPPELVINDEKALLWLNRGAIPTDTVKNLFSSKGIMLRFNLMKNGVQQDKIDEELKKWELLQVERQKREEALKAQKTRDEKIEKVDEKVEVENTEVPGEPVDTPDTTETQSE
jgi:small subunit ribosomal protein S16